MPASSVSFFLLLAASVIFRVLAVAAERRFQARLRALLPRSVTERHLPVLLREFRDRLPLFRARALPAHFGSLAFNTLSCATFLAGLWLRPPGFLSGSDLAFLRYTGLAVVLAAFLADAVAFCRVALAARSGISGPEA